MIVSVVRADLQDLEGSPLHTQFGASNDLPYEQPSVARMYDTGIPTVGNVHEVAHAFTPAARRLRGHRPHHGGAGRWASCSPDWAWPASAAGVGGMTPLHPPDRTP